MPAKHYYSTQTLLAYMIQRFIFNNHFLYIAVEFDAAGNDPTSNPRQIAELWCGVAAGSGSKTGLARWEQIKARLLTVLDDYAARGEISPEEYDEGQRLIAGATERFAAPVLFVIPHRTGDYRIELGEEHSGYQDTEEEYLIPDLKAEGDFEVRFLDC